MINTFYPDLYLNSVDEITPQILHDNKIQGIILDIDDTLVGFRATVPSDSVSSWIKTMKENNIKLCILSNNNSKRVKTISELYDLPGVHRAFKPFRRGFYAAAKLLGLKPNQTAVAGDQIFTDVWGANVSGMFSILIKPIDKRNDILFRLKRGLERRIIKNYDRRKAGGEQA